MEGGTCLAAGPRWKKREGNHTSRRKRKIGARLEYAKSHSLAVEREEGKKETARAEGNDASCKREKKGTMRSEPELLKAGKERERADTCNSRERGVLLIRAGQGGCEESYRNLKREGGSSAPLEEQKGTLCPVKRKKKSRDRSYPEQERGPHAVGHGKERKRVSFREKKKKGVPQGQHHSLTFSLKEEEERSHPLGKTALSYSHYSSWGKKKKSSHGGGRRKGEKQEHYRPGGKISLSY